MTVRVHFMNTLLGEMLEDTFTFSCDSLDEAREIIKNFFDSRGMNFEEDYMYSEVIE